MNYRAAKGYFLSALYIILIGINIYRLPNESTLLALLRFGLIIALAIGAYYFTKQAIKHTSGGDAD